MALLDDVRTSLRITTTTLDTEIQDLIDACKLDLTISGVSIIVETDPLIKRAIKLYVKTDYAQDQDEQRRYNEAYESLKKHLVLSNDYKAV
jgi:hypothetical protein